MLRIKMIITLLIVALLGCQKKYEVYVSNGSRFISKDNYKVVLDSNLKIHQLQKKLDNVTVVFHIEDSRLVEIDSIHTKNSNIESYFIGSQFSTTNMVREKENYKFQLREEEKGSYIFSLFNKYEFDTLEFFDLMCNIRFQNDSIKKEESNYFFLRKDLVFFNLSAYENKPNIKYDVSLLNGPVDSLSPYLYKDRVYLKKTSSAKRSRLDSLRNVGFKAEILKTNFMQIYPLEINEESVNPKNYFLMEFKNSFLKTDSEWRALIKEATYQYNNFNSNDRVMNQLKSFAVLFNFLEYENGRIDIETNKVKKILKNK